MTRRICLTKGSSLSASNFNAATVVRPGKATRLCFCLKSPSHTLSLSLSSCRGTLPVKAFVFGAQIGRRDTNGPVWTIRISLFLPLMLQVMLSCLTAGPNRMGTHYIGAKATIVKENLKSYNHVEVLTDEFKEGVQRLRLSDCIYINICFIFPGKEHRVSVKMKAGIQEGISVLSKSYIWPLQQRNITIRAFSRWPKWQKQSLAKQLKTMKWNE